jgi:hypothetical protein
MERVSTRRGVVESKNFRKMYKMKLVWILEELARDPSRVRLGLAVQGDRVTVVLKLIPQLVFRLQNKELESAKLFFIPT